MSDSDPVEEERDKRSDPRTMVRRCGWVARTKGEQLRECVVRDVSNTGACLVFDKPDEIPASFYIYMTLDFTSRRHCRVVWRSGEQLGVEFLDRPPSA
jgi:hypothetical protein